MKNSLINVDQFVENYRLTNVSEETYEIDVEEGYIIMEGENFNEMLLRVNINI